MRRGYDRVESSKLLLPCQLTGMPALTLSYTTQLSIKLNHNYVLAMKYLRPLWSFGPFVSLVQTFYIIIEDVLFIVYSIKLDLKKLFIFYSIKLDFKMCFRNVSYGLHCKCSGYFMSLYKMAI